MSNLQEVPTDDLLSFQDYPAVPVHSPTGNRTVSVPVSQIDGSGNLRNDPVYPAGNMHSTKISDVPDMSAGGDADPVPPAKSFWTVEYYQKYFNVDTKDVAERILASVTPKFDNSLTNHLRMKPDLYGPFWICVTLVFTIAISGNITNYLQHASTKYHWKYDFHLVSYAASAISVYVTLVPLVLWGLLRYTSSITTDVEQLDEETVTPGAMELICIYGYSLFIYIPTAILWSIQIEWVQWILVFLAAFVSGSVLLLTLMPALRLSRHKVVLIMGIVACHLWLAAGFMLYFFHVPNTVPVPKDADPATDAAAAAAAAAAAVTAGGNAALKLNLTKTV